MVSSTSLPAQMQTVQLETILRKCLNNQHLMPHRREVSLEHKYESSRADVQEGQ